MNSEVMTYGHTQFSMNYFIERYMDYRMLLSAKEFGPKDPVQASG